jgi:hypothetical protein
MDLALAPHLQKITLHADAIIEAFRMLREGIPLDDPEYQVTLQSYLRQTSFSLATRGEAVNNLRRPTFAGNQIRKFGLVSRTQVVGEGIGACEHHVISDYAGEKLSIPTDLHDKQKWEKLRSEYIDTNKIGPEQSYVLRQILIDESFTSSASIEQARISMSSARDLRPSERTRDLSAKNLMWTGVLPPCTLEKFPYYPGPVLHLGSGDFHCLSQYIYDECCNVDKVYNGTSGFKADAVLWLKRNIQCLGAFSAIVSDMARYIDLRRTRQRAKRSAVTCMDPDATNKLQGLTFSIIAHSPAAHLIDEGKVCLKLAATGLIPHTLSRQKFFAMPKMRMHNAELVVVTAPPGSGFTLDHLFRRTAPMIIKSNDLRHRVLLHEQQGCPTFGVDLSLVNRLICRDYPDSLPRKFAKVRRSASQIVPNQHHYDGCDDTPEAVSSDYSQDIRGVNFAGY